MPEHDELDMLIDSALSKYAEARSGLEQRVLAHIPGEATASWRHRWMTPAITALVAASLLIVTYLVSKASHSGPDQLAYTPAAPPPARVLTAPATAQTPRSISNVHGRHEKRRTERGQSNPIQRPKLNVFPTPQPFSAGEQALIRFVAQAPEADRKSLVEARRSVADPMNISAIRIPPLQPPEEDQQ